MRTGIYGGTFSPPHNAHVRAAAAFMSEYALDRLIVIPALIPPHKALEDDDPRARLDMAALAFLPLGERVEVSDIELRRAGVSYTSDTLTQLRADISGELYMLCGTDMFMTLGSWHEPETIFALAEIVCARRYDSDDADALERARREYIGRYGARVSFLSLPPLALSSTEVRCESESGGDIYALVPPAVARYIKEHGLYKKDR